MSTVTPRLGLVKYGLSDRANIVDTLAHDFDILDEKTVLEEDVAEAVAAKGPVYGVCETAAQVAVKAVSTVFASLDVSAGLVLAVTFSSRNSAQNPELDVNLTGAKPVVRSNGEAPSPDAIPLNAVFALTDTGLWLLINESETDAGTF